MRRKQLNKVELALRLGLMFKHERVIAWLDTKPADYSNTERQAALELISFFTVDDQPDEFSIKP